MASAQRTALLVPEWPLHDVRLATHAANLSVARATPDEQPYVVGWDVIETAAGFVVVLDVDDDPDQRSRWLAHFPTNASLQEEPGGTALPDDATVREEQLALDDDSMAAQQSRDGLLDRFHATREAADAFGREARAWVGEGADFYCLDTAGVRTYWPSSPLEAPLRQTLDDVAIGYGGPVGYAVTAMDDDGWRRIAVGALGRVTWSEWRAR
ncbi:MAG TPA: hypothetical protein VLI04_15135 [Nocardioidaceae bacterium]|nr:hypothetical protein [Nocardioidaceae bacterium]